MELFGNRRTALARSICAAASTLAFATPVVAQQAPKAEGTAGVQSLEEIVVTAQRREQRLIDVPVPVTAITAADIEKHGVSNLQDIQYSVPGLTMSEFGPGQGRLQLDGIGTAGGATGLPTVGIYLDEMPITGNGAGSELDLRLLDLQRVEVLHGPQPTLYGEGSMGGTIHYVTAPVDLTHLGGSLEGSVGTVTHGDTSYDFSGVLNAPIVDGKFGIRVVAADQKQGGWIDSADTGAKGINGVEIKTVRLKALYQPTSDLSVSLMWLHQQHDLDYKNYADENTRITSAVLASPSTDRYDLANLIVTYTIGTTTLLSSTGLIHRESTDGYDQSAYFAPLLNYYGFTDISKVGEYTTGRANMASQEFRVTSNTGTAFNYTAGLYYRNYRSDGTLTFTTAPGALPFAIDDDTSASKSESWAAYGELRYAFTSSLEALLGLRHFEDKRSVSDSYCSFGACAAEAASGKFSTTNPRLNVSYKLSANSLLYADVAKGFRSGGFNSQSGGPVPPTYGPEALWTYTVGSKQEWLDHRLSTDLSVYRNQWNDIQVVGISGGIANTFSSNTGKASGTGVNFGLTARPTPNLTLSATLGYNDMKYDEAAASVDKGDPLDMVTKLTYSAGVDYRIPVSSRVALETHLDFAHTDGYALTIRRTPFREVNPTGPRDVLNARVAANFGKWQAYLYAHNLTDDKGVIYPIVGSLPEPVVAAPRTIGIGARFDF